MIEKLIDRFFLEEIIKRLDDANQWDSMDEYPKQLIKDWMREKIEDYPISEIEREFVATKMQGEDYKEFYFDSEKTLRQKIDLE